MKTSTSNINNKIDEKTCENLSLQEKIFSVLATGKCEDSLIEDTLNNNTCWGEESCNVKLTAQAILALEKTDTENSLYKSVNWLSSQNKTSSQINWYLQINAPTNTNCSINYSNNNYRFKINEDEKLEHIRGSSPYFSIDGTKYKINIREGYYNKGFTVSCTSSFETSFLFEKDDSLYISDLTKSGSANQGIKLKINSLSFDGYESSLWASLALRKTHRDISSFLPYLIAMSEDPRFNEYLPESFLYFLTDDESYSSELISKQKEGKYWMESDNRFYDTAVALFPFANKEFSTKQNTTNWLEENQGEDGCWDEGNIVNTAFLLFSTGSSFTIQQEENETVEECSSLGGFCMSESACNSSGGDSITESGCSGWDICCNKEETETMCSDIGGTVCESGEGCTGYYSQEVVKDSCCVNGTCEESETTEEENETFTSECENYLGNCRTSCFENETIGDYSCVSPSDECCIPTEEEKSYLWLWIILGVLIVLAVGFIFRKKVIKFFKTRLFKKKSKKPKKGRKLPMRPRPSSRPKRMKKPLKPMSKSSKTKSKKIPSKKPSTKQKPQPQSSRQAQQKDTSMSNKESKKQASAKKQDEKKEPKDDIFKKLKEMGEE